MKISQNIQTLAVALGLGLFVATGLFVTVSANRHQPVDAQRTGPIPESVSAPAEQLGAAFAAVAAHVKPAVVGVYSEKIVRFQAPDFQLPFGEDFFNQFFGGQFQSPRAPGEPREYRIPQRGMGTGMILDQAGHILTNYHVVKDVDQIKVQLPDKRTFEAKIVSADPKTDVAVLAMRGDLPRGLPVVQLGDSDALDVGYLVMAIGAPFGLTQTVTTGIISAKGRSDVGITDYEDFLQTDAAINPGNSGGPLINMRGEVIGMNSAIETNVGQSAGVGFAIPANMIKTVLPTLLKGEQVTRGVLGVVIQDVTKELAEQFHVPAEKGALISQVNKGSPADKAGLKAGDVIVRYDSKEVMDGTHLRNLVAATAPGTEVSIIVVRNGHEQTLTAKIGEMTSERIAAAKPSKGAANQLARLGLRVQTLTPELARQFGIEEDKGVVITGVESGSFAADAGVQPGDLIVEADRKPVANVAQLQSILSRSKDRVLFLIKRKTGSMYLVFRLG